MQEFGATASASLTLEEFMQVDLEEEHDPPAFLQSRKKDRNDKGDEVVINYLCCKKKFLVQFVFNNRKRKGCWN